MPRSVSPVTVSTNGATTAQPVQLPHQQGVAGGAWSKTCSSPSRRAASFTAMLVDVLRELGLCQGPGDGLDRVDHGGNHEPAM